MNEKDLSILEFISESDMCKIWMDIFRDTKKKAILRTLIDNKLVEVIPRDKPGPLAIKITDKGLKVLEKESKNG